MGSIEQYHVGTYRLVCLVYSSHQIEVLSLLICVSPQRDERRGWMGDAALSVNEALYNFDLIKFYLNFLNLIDDVQHSDGSIPDVVPDGGGYPGKKNRQNNHITIDFNQK
jgi:hypothetical protein